MKLASYRKAHTIVLYKMDFNQRHMLSKFALYGGLTWRLLIRSPVGWWRNLVSLLSWPKITIYSMQKKAREKQKSAGLTREISKIFFKVVYEEKIFL